MNTGYTPVQGRGFVRPEKQNLQNFAEIIPVISGVIGGRETTIVSARALHKALGVGRVFRSWIKGRIEEYGFTEGVDYEVVEYLSRPDPVSAKSRQQTALEYIITVNMAKELAMVERTEQGRAVRQYFIKCEEELHKVTNHHDDDLHFTGRMVSHYENGVEVSRERLRDDCCFGTLPEFSELLTRCDYRIIQGGSHG